MRLPRFYPILDTAVLELRGFDALHAAAALLEAGVELLQLRHKSQYTRARFDEAKRIAAMARNARATFIVNDRADIALIIDAAGVHVGQDDLAPSDVRRLLGPSRIIGFSTHNLPQITDSASEPIDYVAFGPIFGTQSKQNPDPEVGLERLQAIRGMTPLPLTAIGGITRHTASRVLAAGADTIAVIGDLYPQPLTYAALRERASEWLSLLRRSPS